MKKIELIPKFFYGQKMSEIFDILRNKINEIIENENLQYIPNKYKTDKEMSVGLSTLRQIINEIIKERY